MRKILFACGILLSALLFICPSVDAQFCTAPFNGGEIAATPDTTCPKTSFMIAVSGGISGMGIVYQWESSADSTIWKAMPAYTERTIGSAFQSATTWYRRKTKCGNDSAYSNMIRIYSRPGNECLYCTPGNSDCNNGFTITKVAYGLLNNSSGCSDNGYTNYTASIPPVDIMQGSWLPVSITTNGSQTGRYVHCLMDLDHDGKFDAKGEHVLLKVPAGNVYNGFFKVPFGAKIGVTRMRFVFTDYLPLPGDCFFVQNAETEDYAVRIVSNTTTARGHVIYVKGTATGSNNFGNSWANALTEPKAAVQIAAPGDTIKVAKGLYYSGTSRTNGLELIDSITLLGGYPDTGTPTNSVRNVATNPTILSGSPGNQSTDYDYHVLYARGKMNDCTVDGFILQEGGNHLGPFGQERLYRGGGISIEDSANVVVKNCVFRNNPSSITGAAIAVYNARPQFQNCIVTSQGHAERGYYFQHTIDIQKNSEVTFVNLLAARNIVNNLIRVDDSKAAFRNSTIAGNELEEVLASALNNSEIKFSNTIFYNNTVSAHINGSLDSAEVRIKNSVVYFQNCLTQVQNTGSNLLLGQPPRFTDGTNVTGTDGFYFTADDGYSLLNPCSPAINAGSNIEAAGISTDIKGSPRVFENTVDLGAYEVQQNRAPIPGVLYVNAAATGTNDGTSWANAFTDLHKALEACSDTIKVAAGTYAPWNTTATGPYWLQNKRIVWGAYPATGNPTNSARNYTLYPTIIDGRTINDGAKEIVVRGQNLDSTSVFDGFTVSHVGWNINAYTYGALIYSNCNNPIISNCTFSTNTGRIFWGWNNKAPKMRNCQFNDNTTTERLDFLYLNNSGRFLFEKCSFRNNKLPNATSFDNEFGRILYLVNTNAIFDSCIFLSSKSTVFHLVRSNPVFNSAKFLQNFANGEPTCFRNQFSSPVFYHSVFTDSIGSFYTLPNRSGTIHNVSSNPVFTDCRFNNGRGNMGGVAYNNNSKPRFTRCVFSNTIHTFYNENDSDIELTNCINTGSRVYGNYFSSLIQGGSFMHNIGSSPKLKNCVVVNGFSGSGGVIYNDAGSTPQISNSIFWRNFQAPYIDSMDLKRRSDIFNVGLNRPMIQNSMFEFYQAGSAEKNTVGVDPRFRNFENPVGPDSTWFTADDGLQLCDCSPAINSGNNAANTESTDVVRQPRLFGQTIDRGAYELQMVPAKVPRTYFVNASASGANNGTSWLNAYTSLHTALGNACTDTIKMAQGVYMPATKQRDSIFYVNRNLAILGSYAAPSSNRDVEAYPTILSGNLSLANDSSDNSFGLLKAWYADSVTMDGVVFRDANSEGVPGAQQKSAVRVNYVQSLAVTNSRFYNNRSHLHGGALYLENTGKTAVQKTVFSQNKAVRGGALFFWFNGDGASRNISNCVFDGNTADYEGGAVWVTSEGGTAAINSLFTRNKARQGGAMYFSGGPDAEVTNCTFANNTLLDGNTVGAGIYCNQNPGSGSGLGPLVGNCIFADDSAISPPLKAPYWDMFFQNKEHWPVEGGLSKDHELVLRIHHTASQTKPVYHSGGGNIYPNGIRYKHPGNAIGPDGRWFTGDDGLQLSACSDGINRGRNESVTTGADLADGVRIINKTVDMGAYESDGQADWSALLDRPNDSLDANREITDTLGWTHYFNDCRYLLSIKKNGKEFGAVGDGTFELKVFTGANYNSGYGANLTAAAYNTSGQPWYVMNRYWNVKPTIPLQDSILVRFPYTAADFNDVKGSNPLVSKHTDMEFFKVNGTNNPFDLSVTTPNFFRYKNAALPSLSTWKYLQQDTVHLCEYFVKGFSGGGGGALYTGPLPDLTVSAASVAPATMGAAENFTASITEANVSTTGDAGGHRVLFYLSKDNLLTPGANGDTLLGSFVIAGVNASKNTGLLHKQLTIPCTTVPGDYFLFFVADGEDVVVETDENNNRTSVPLTIKPGSGAPAAPTITASPGTTVCTGTEVTLTGTTADCSSCTYSWSGNSLSGNTIRVTAAGTYTLTVTNACGAATSSQTIVVNPQPSVSVLTNNNGFCLGDSASLTAFGADSYTWSGPGLSATAGITVSAKPLNAGSHAYTVSGVRNGCSKTATLTISVIPSPVLSITPADTTYCAGSSMTLTASGADSYSWSPATGLNTTTGAVVTASPSTTTSYTLTGTASSGCRSTITRMVKPLPAVTPLVKFAYSGCPDNRLQFTATPTNGGLNPTFQWYLNGVVQGSGATISINNVVNGSDVYVRMTSDAGCASPRAVNSDTVKISCITTALPQIDAVETLTVSPVPTTGTVYVRLKLTQRRKLSFQITNSEGRKVYQSDPVNALGAVVKQLDLSGQAQGFYFLHIIIGNKTVIEKILITR